MKDDFQVFNEVGHILIEKLDKDSIQKENLGRYL